jgi:hypothetical protein
MEKVEMNGNRAYALPCFLAGLGAGIAVTALLVPRSGAATRRLLGHKVEEGEDWVKAKAAVAQDYVSKRGAALGDRVKETAEMLQSRRKANRPGRTGTA